MTDDPYRTPEAISDRLSGLAVAHQRFVDHMREVEGRINAHIDTLEERLPAAHSSEVMDVRRKLNEERDRNNAFIALANDREDVIEKLRKANRELERQLGETRESLAKRSDALTKADARLSRIRHELRYNPQITAQSHLNRVRRVAGVGRYSS